MISIKQPLTNVQLELLKLYSTNFSEQELLELKDLLAQYYAKKSIEHANTAWTEKNFTNELMDEWLITVSLRHKA